MQESSAAVSRSRIVIPLIVTGAVMFVLGLVVSAAFAPEWRALHALQALIYAAIVILCWRNSAWGYGSGVFIALFWNWISTVTTTATRDGVAELARVIGGRGVQRPDLLLSLFAFAGHVLIIVGCAVGFAQLRPTRREWVKFVAGGAVCLAYLLAIVFVFGPPQAAQLMRRVFGG